MKLGFHSATTMTSPLETDIAVSAQAGFSGLEVWVGKIDDYLSTHSLAELKALFTNQKVDPMVLNSIEFIGFRGTDYPIIQARTRHFCEIAQTIGCPAVAVVPGPIPSHETSWQEIEDEYVGVLRNLGTIAQSFGIKLAFEPLGFGWCTVRTPRGAWEIVQRVDMDNIGIVIDAAHFYSGGGLMDEIEAIPVERIFAFHLDDLEDLPKEAVTDAARLMPGEGIVPLEAIIKRLKQINYDGSCSIELFRPEYWQIDPLVVAKRAKNAAVQLLAPHFNLS